MYNQQSVLLTGSNGYLGAWVALKLVQRGYRVRASFRSQKKAQELIAARSELAEAHQKGTFEVVIIENLEKGDLPKHLAGIHHVIHCASPFHFGGGDADEVYIKPAIESTLNILRAVKSDPTKSVKSVVITSSFVAMLDYFDPKNPKSGRIYRESDWLNVTRAEAIKSEDTVLHYCASKKLAEEAAIAYIRENLPDLRVVTLCPTLIVGPFTHSVPSLEQLNTSLATISQFLNTPPKSEADADQQLGVYDFPVFVDVRDCAEAHVLALEREEANGRIALYSGPVDFQIIADIARRTLGNEYIGPKGKPGSYTPVGQEGGVYAIDQSKAKKMLGLSFRDPKDTWTDTITQIQTLKTKGSASGEGY